jgi:hypothetical protein
LQQLRDVACSKQQQTLTPCASKIVGFGVEKQVPAGVASDARASVPGTDNGPVSVAIAGAAAWLC